MFVNGYLSRYFLRIKIICFIYYGMWKSVDNHYMCKKLEHVASVLSHVSSTNRYILLFKFNLKFTTCCVKVKNLRIKSRLFSFHNNINTQRTGISINTFIYSSYALIKMKYTYIKIQNVKKFKWFFLIIINKYHALHLWLNLLTVTV